MLFKKGGGLLMQLRDEKPGLPYAGMWSIPSGHVEAEESAEECARREMREETGYRCGHLVRLVTMTDRDDTDTDYKLTIFREFYDGRQKLKCREGQAIRFISRAGAVSHPMPSFILKVWDRAIKDSMPHEKN